MHKHSTNSWGSACTCTKTPKIAWGNACMHACTKPSRFHGGMHACMHKNPQDCMGECAQKSIIFHGGMHACTKTLEISWGNACMHAQKPPRLHGGMHACM